MSRFQCEVCSKLASIQVFYNKSGVIKYARARHYTGQLNGKPQFEYHQQSLNYIERKLSEIPIVKTEIGHIGQQINDDPKNPELSSKLSTMAGGVSYEPSFEPSGRNGVEDCTPNFWVKGAKQSILHKEYRFYRYELKILKKMDWMDRYPSGRGFLAIARRW